MKSSIKKVLALSLAAVLLLGVAACGANQNGTDVVKRVAADESVENASDVVDSNSNLVSSIQDYNQTSQIGISKADTYSYSEYNQAENGTYSIDGELLNVDYILTTGEKSIPVCAEDSSLLTSKNLDNLSEFAYEAKRAKNEEVNSINDEYEFILIDEDATYVYYDKSYGTFLFIIEPANLDSSDSINASVTRAGSPVVLPDGIGARSKTYSTSTNTFNANVTASNLNYNGSPPSTATQNGINFYNYLGITGTGIEGDLGLIWSYTYQGWYPCYLLRQGGITYFNDPKYSIPNLLIGSWSNKYKATQAYPTSITVNKYYNYNGSYKIGLTVSGMLTDLSGSATTTIVAGSGLSSSLQYKVLTTIACEDQSKILRGARIDTDWSNVNIGGVQVTTYASVEYDNATINLTSTGLQYIVQKQ